MNTIEISKIHIGSRQRKAFDETSLVELAHSIVKRGLLHAPVVRKSGKDGRKLILVAGERRLRAMKQIHEAHESLTLTYNGELIPQDHTPYILITSTDEISIRETELEENLIREDLTWQERISALEELHTLRKAQNGGHTVSDTAREIAGKTNDTTPTAAIHNVTVVRKEIARANIIAPFLNDPDVANARSASRAFGIVSAKLETEFMAELRSRGEMGITDHELIHGDLRDELKKLPEEKFSCIIADPPYGIGANQFGDNARFTHRYKDDSIHALELIRNLSGQASRITEEEAHMYIFCDIDLFITIREMINDSKEWNCWRTPIIWAKGSGHAPQQSSGLQRTYELILLAIKGKKPFALPHRDIIEIPLSRDQLHAAAKPPQLYAELLSRSCIPGDRVLDPCCGSGPIFSAAKIIGVIATGIELDKEWLDTARIKIYPDE
jgi:DNA modification methylase